MSKSNMNTSEYALEKKSEEVKDFFDKYSATGEPEWTRDSVIPFDDVVLSERHYHTENTESAPALISYRISDDDIRNNVSVALYGHAEIDASDVSVEVSHGIVTLVGVVQTLLEKKIAQMTTERLPGVLAVNNKIIIQNPKTKGLVMGHSPVP